MSKQKRNIIAVIVCVLTLAVAVGIFFITNKASPKKEDESELVSSDISSNVNIEDIESERYENQSEVNTDESEIEFLEPDETKADEILANNKNNVTASSTNTSSVPKVESSKPQGSSNGPQSFEEGKQQLADKALQYLKEHNIDIKTAGETGELCQNCGKKLWNPDKYGTFIPGMPEDYENSGYCLGTCGITFE